MSDLTQRQLAACLGLSYATVSRVFNGDTRVKEPTRQRVLREAERMGFHGHSLARALRLKKSFAIGMIGANSPHSYWADVLSSLERRARGAGYHVILCHRRDEQSGSAEEIHFLLERHVDALILSPHPENEDPLLLRQVVEHGRPLLLFNSCLPGFAGHYLGTDSRTGSRRACEYLLGLGHRRIAFLAGPPGDYPAECRLAGYESAMAGCDGAEPAVLPAGWSQAGGEAVVEKLLAMPRRPTAVMAVNDPVAIGFYLELRRRGVRVPEEISLVGYSGDRNGELLAIPLTTVAQPVERLGERAAELVLELIEGLHPRPVFEELPDTLVIRGSCGPPAGCGREHG